VCFGVTQDLLDLYKETKLLPQFLGTSPNAIMMSSVDQPPAKQKSLCYRSSYIRKGEGTITEKEYFHNIFRHLTGVKHKGDDNEREELKELDPLGYSINCWIVRHQNKPIKGKPQYPALIPNYELTVVDCSPFEDVFDAFLNNSLEILKTALEKIPKDYKEDIRKSLALLALQKRNVEVLKWLLDEGISYEEVFEDEVRRVMKGIDPETWKLLQFTAERTKIPWTKREQVKYSNPLW
jgi:hypothetical protein